MLEDRRISRALHKASKTRGRERKKFSVPIPFLHLQKMSRRMSSYANFTPSEAERWNDAEPKKKGTKQDENGQGNLPLQVAKRNWLTTSTRGFFCVSVPNNPKVKRINIIQSR